MSTETTSTTTTTTARTMRVAVTGSPFTARRDHSSDPPKPQSPPWTPDQDWSLAGYLKASQPRKPGSPGQHRPQLRHRVAHLRPRRQIIHLPHSPPSRNASATQTTVTSTGYTPRRRNEVLTSLSNPGSPGPSVTSVSPPPKVHRYSTTRNPARTADPP